jgi:hypothetical protein
MNSKRIVQPRTHIHILNPSPEKKQSSIDCELGDANERNSKFALSCSGDSIVDVNTYTYFSEESTTTPQNCSDT